MHTRVLRPGDLGPAERDIWDAFLRADPSLASPFLTPEFALAVDGARDDARASRSSKTRVSPVAFLRVHVVGGRDRRADRRDDL